MPSFRYEATDALRKNRARHGRGRHRARRPQPAARPRPAAAVHRPAARAEGLGGALRARLSDADLAWLTRQLASLLAAPAAGRGPQRHAGPGREETHRHGAAGRARRRARRPQAVGGAGRQAARLSRDLSRADRRRRGIRRPGAGNGKTGRLHRGTQRAARQGDDGLHLSRRGGLRVGDHRGVPAGLCGAAGGVGLQPRQAAAAHADPRDAGAVGLCARMGPGHWRRAGRRLRAVALRAARAGGAPPGTRACCACRWSAASCWA